MRFPLSSFLTVTEFKWVWSVEHGRPAAIVVPTQWESIADIVSVDANERNNAHRETDEKLEENSVENWSSALSLDCNVCYWFIINTNMHYIPTPYLNNSL